MIRELLIDREPTVITRVGVGEDGVIQIQEQRFGKLGSHALRLSPPAIHSIVHGLWQGQDRLILPRRSFISKGQKRRGHPL